MRALPALACALFLLGGCEKAMQDMYNQPRYKPLAPSSLWADGRSARPQVPGTLASGAGALASASSGRAGATVSAAASPPVTMPLLVRGRERYAIYCAPCHSESGDGDGMVVRRGFPRPASFHTDALRQAPDGRIFAAITNGYGVMYPHADRIDPADRWAIVAYVRALQLSQHARIEDVPLEQRAALGAAAK